MTLLLLMPHLVPSIIACYINYWYIIVLISPTSAKDIALMFVLDSLSYIMSAAPPIYWLHNASPSFSPRLPSSTPLLQSATAVFDPDSLRVVDQRSDENVLLGDECRRILRDYEQSFDQIRVIKRKIY